MLGIPSKDNSCKTPKCLQPLRIMVPLERPYPESDMLIHIDGTQEPEGSLNYTQYKQSKTKTNKQKMMLGNCGKQD